jgi:pantoate--beta-alanine ligase
MIICTTRIDLSRHADQVRKRGKVIGLVPTMGTLHPGHLSLVERSTAENDFTAVSIFVNPTQFNDPSDLENYPRTPESDIELLQSHGVDLVFAPSVEEMYPEPDQRTFDLGGLDKVMEGAARKGHFNGVAQIVSKLFETVHPHRAYFGQKDFQQLVIIRHLVQTLGLDIRIIACPIIREKDGLAMSSRNILLNREQRRAAPLIHRTLREAQGLRWSLTPADLKEWVTLQFKQHPLLRLEYFEIVEEIALRPAEAWEEGGNKVGCIAVNLGHVRLIDNVIFD